MRIIYKEIIDGFSFADDTGVYFKHLSDFDGIEILKQKEILRKKYASQGIPTEKDRLAQIISSGDWSKEKEEKIEDLRLAISDNEKNLKKLIIQQHAVVKAMIEKTRKELHQILIDRYYAIGTTIEQLVVRDINSFELCLVAYKDRELTKRYFHDFEEIEDDDDETEKIQKSLDASLEKFDEKNIKYISVCPFFINLFSHCKDNITTFLGKPIISLTSFQLFLISCGQRNISILNQTEGNPPELSSEVSLDDVVKWYDQQFSIILTKRS